MRNATKPAAPGLGERVRFARENKGYRQSALADLSEVDRSFVNRIETEPVASPDVSQLTRVAKTLGVSVDYLLSGSPVSEIVDAYLASDLARTLDPPLTTEELFELRTDSWTLGHRILPDLRGVDDCIRARRDLRRRQTQGK